MAWVAVRSSVTKGPETSVRFILENSQLAFGAVAESYDGWAHETSRKEASVNVVIDPL